MEKGKIGPIIQQEITLINVMIECYYRKHGAENDVTREQMLAYAQRRLEVCRFGEAKPTCQHCPVHCYHPRYRTQMKIIMRYSGPRMLVSHPILTLKHAYRGVTRRAVK